MSLYLLNYFTIIKLLSSSKSLSSKKSLFFTTKITIVKNKQGKIIEKDSRKYQNVFEKEETTSIMSWKV